MLVFVRERVRNRDALYSGAVPREDAPRGVKPYMVNVDHHSISCRGRGHERDERICTMYVDEQIT